MPKLPTVIKILFINTQWIYNTCAILELLWISLRGKRKKSLVQMQACFFQILYDLTFSQNFGFLVNFCEQSFDKTDSSFEKHGFRNEIQL